MSTMQTQERRQPQLHGRGTALWWSGCPLSVYTPRDHLEAPLEVPTISQWHHHYSGLAMAQTAGTKTLRRPHCDMSTCSHRVIHTHPRETPSHRPSQELTWTLGCRPTGCSTRPRHQADRGLSIATARRDFPSSDKCVEFLNNKARFQERKF